MKKYNYISLFSGGGVGCYGFKMAEFDCIATCELLEERINIQKFNNKCKYESGYIIGNIEDNAIKKKINDEIDYWKKNELITDIDVIVATPPCQGMSTANYKKNNEIKRNSLVVEAIEIINHIQPTIFIFENVRAFLNTDCTGKDSNNYKIKDYIHKILDTNYNIFYKTINFSEYGVPSSRPRTIVIGTKKSKINISPLNIFPLKEKKVTLRDSIYDLKKLNTMGEIDDNDIYHFYRSFPEYMIEWIKDLKEGESAFNGKIKPYKIVDGQKIELKSAHLGNKFRRLFWDKIGACIATRNDQLASQDTIHPSDNRVLSIRELMKLMTIPDSFNWTNLSNTELNSIELKRKQFFLRKNELNIRRIIGESVPTKIFYDIAKNIKEILDYNNNLILKHKENFYINSDLVEKQIINVKETGSFYTPQSIIFNLLKNIKVKKKKIKILEPSIGMGNFLPQLLRIFDDCEKIEITCIDISEEIIKNLINNLKNLKYQKDKFIFHFVVKDFLSFSMQHYDYIIGNPPYFKTLKSKYNSINMFANFLEHSYKKCDELLFIIPKTFLMADSYFELRKKYESYYYVKNIIDNGIHAFEKVFIETISIHFTKLVTTTNINILNTTYNEILPINYIYHDKVWLIYRNEWFDNFIKEIALDFFIPYRDRQISNKLLETENGKNKIWVIKSKNLLSSSEFIHISNYDKYISNENLNLIGIKKFINQKEILIPNFTYNIRASWLPKNTIPNGSLVIMKPKYEINKENIDLSFFSTDDYHKYYKIIKNNSKFTINIDKCTAYYIGPLKKGLS